MVDRYEQTEEEFMREARANHVCRIIPADLHPNKGGVIYMVRKANAPAGYTVSYLMSKGKCDQPPDDNKDMSDPRHVLVDRYHLTPDWLQGYDPLRDWPPLDSKRVVEIIGFGTDSPRVFATKRGDDLPDSLRDTLLQVSNSHRPTQPLAPVPVENPVEV